MNTGEEVDDWRCAMNWLPMLLIENSGMQRATSVAAESFRNEMVKANEVNQQVLLAAIQDVPTEPKDIKVDRKSTRLNSSHIPLSRMPSSA